METKSLKINKESFVSIYKGDITQYYEIIKKIGEGGYGKIYKVKNKESGDIRAMKQILKSKIPDIEKFQNEIKILSMVDHPNIVRLFEVIEDDKYFNLFQELCTGGELLSKVQKPLKEKEIAKIFKQIMSAIAYCHEKGIVHRDMKLENILFSTESEDSPIKIIDFGLSVLLGKKDVKENEVTDLKKYGFKRMTTKVGTIYYMSPEVIKGNYDEKCDIWACGVILYTLLAGYPPFNGQTDKDIYNMISKMSFDFEQPVWKGVSKYAKELIKKMLSPAKSRYTAEEVLNSKWLSVKTKKNDEKINYYLDYKHIEKYKSYNKFKQVILTFIASRLSSEESDKIRNIFCSIDESQKGFITYEDFSNYLINECNIDEFSDKQNEIKKAFKSVDIDQNNAIDYTEFLAANIDDNIYLKEEKLKEAFRKFDLEDVGYIKKEDIIRVLKLDNLEDKDKIANKIIEENDFDKDGKINFNDFMTAMKK
jgi:calcium-dependent protein kinase